MATHSSILAWRISTDRGYSPWVPKGLDVTEWLTFFRWGSLIPDGLKKFPKSAFSEFLTLVTPRPRVLPPSDLSLPQAAIPVTPMTHGKGLQVSSFPRPFPSWMSHQWLTGLGRPPGDPSVGLEVWVKVPPGCVRLALWMHSWTGSLDNSGLLPQELPSQGRKRHERQNERAAQSGCRGCRLFIRTSIVVN